MTNPEIAQKFPYAIEVDEGETYFWCACGKSDKQPFCDGSHSNTEFRPIKYIAEESAKVFFCGCKYSENKPFCDGRHKEL
jgi:CDGSH-type Zn-finger protein